MGSSTPKQFLELKGRPILFYTIEKFLEFDPSLEIILVLPADHIDTWNSLCSSHSFDHSLTVVEGGKERFHSVKNGIEKATGNIIAVHDGVRPFVSAEVLVEVFSAAEEKGAALPVIAPKESIRVIEGDASSSVDRSKYKLVQTPQVFQRDVLLKAYQSEYKSTFTDDASVVENSGHSITLVEGNEENIKITTPTDLMWAELFI